MIKLRGRAVLFPVYAALIFLFLYFSKGVLTPFVIGAFIAYIIYPVVVFLSEKFKITTSTSSGIVIAIVYFLLLASLTIFLPILYRELYSIASNISSENIDKLNTKLLSKAKMLLPSSVFPLFEEALRNVPPYLFRLSQEVMYRIIISAKSLLTILVSIIISPVVAYYMVKDIKLIRSAALMLLPKNMKKKATYCFKQVNSVCNTFLHGQVLIALIWSLYYTICFQLIGIKTAIALGVFSGVSCLIPYIGAIFSFIVISFVTVLQFEDFTNQLYLALMAYSVGHMLDVALVSNKILGGKLGLHPLLTIFSLLFSASFFGVLGIFIAIPSAVLIKKAWLALLYRLKTDEMKLT